MMNRKQPLRDHPMIRCPNIRSKLTGEHFTKKHDSKLLLCIFIEISLRHGWHNPLQIRRICSKKLLKSNTSKGLLAMPLHTTLIVNIRKLYLTWHHPEAVFKNTLVYWHKSSRRWVSFYWKKLAAVPSSIIFS